MKLRIIVALANSIAIILLFIVKVICKTDIDNLGYSISVFIRDSIIMSAGLFLFAVSVNFCIVHLVDALLLVFGKLKKKDCNSAYIRILAFTVLLIILVYITGLHKYDINIAIIPILVCAVLCFVYYFNRSDSLKDKKIEMESEKKSFFKNNFFSGIIWGFFTSIVLNSFFMFYLIVYIERQFFIYEFLILSSLFIVSTIVKIIMRIIGKIKKMECRVIKLSDFFLGFSIGGIIGIIAGLVTVVIIIMAYGLLKGGV